MPYVVCPSCELRFYSAAAYSTRGRCESCGAEVPTAPRAGRAAQDATVARAVSGRAAPPSAGR